MDEKLISPAFSVHSNKGVYALLLGSGISRSAGIPTGWEVMNDLIRKTATLEGITGLEEPSQWYIQRYEKEPDYSDILEKLTKTSEERINLLRPYFEPTNDELESGNKMPTIAHQQIANLVKNGYIKVIITTNFDRLIETAMSQVGVFPSIISNPNHVENVLPIVHSKATLIKINGDYLDTKFLNIKSELTEYDPRICNLLTSIFEDFGLITCGWSAKWDIGLVNIIDSANKFRFSTFITHLSKPDESIIKLSNQRMGNLIQIKSADHFFTEIAENIEALENNQQTNPLSGKIVLSRIKKHISNTDGKIKLFDLINDITESTVASIRQRGQYLTNKVLDGYKADLELLAIALANASYWAKKDHYAMILRSITRVYLGSDLNLQSGDFTRFPTVILRYAIGIACVAAEQYDLLSNLCNHQVRAPNLTTHSTLRLTELTNQWLTITRDSFATYFTEPYHFPQSKFIHDYLRPIFTNLIPDDLEFTYTLQLYELITCVNHLEHKPIDGFPEGCYLGDPNQVAKKRFIALLSKKSQSVLFRSGLFDEQENLEEKVDRHYSERSKFYYF